VNSIKSALISWRDQCQCECNEDKKVATDSIPTGKIEQSFRPNHVDLRDRLLFHPFPFINLGAPST
jgi:hypothetical protein